MDANVFVNRPTTFRCSEHKTAEFVTVGVGQGPGSGSLTFFFFSADDVERFAGVLREAAGFLRQKSEIDAAHQEALDVEAEHGLVLAAAPLERALSEESDEARIAAQAVEPSRFMALLHGVEKDGERFL